MAKPQTDRRRLYLCFPHWTKFAGNPRYLRYAVERVIAAGWCPVIPAVYLLPTPPPDSVTGDIIGNQLATCDALMICYDEHMTSYMTNEIVAAKRLGFHVLHFNVGKTRMEELSNGDDG